MVDIIAPSTPVGVIDPSGNEAGNMVLGSKLAGEDITNDVQKVEQGSGFTLVDCGAGATTACGAAGQIGDYLNHIILRVTGATSTCWVRDGATEYQVGTSGMTTNNTFVIPIHARSVVGGWGVRTGANAAAIAVGRFT